MELGVQPSTGPARRPHPLRRVGQGRTAAGRGTCLLRRASTSPRPAEPSPDARRPNAPTSYYEGIRWVHERFAAFAGLPQPVDRRRPGLLPWLRLRTGPDGRHQDRRRRRRVRAAGDRDRRGRRRGRRSADRARRGRGLGQTARPHRPPHRRPHRGTRSASSNRSWRKQSWSPPARDRAAEIAANAPLAVRSVKRDIDAFADAGLAEALDRTALAAALTLTSEDAREGYAAKAARRPPSFEGT